MKKYLSQLENTLAKFAMTKEERKEILQDYEEMYRDALDKGLSEAEVEAKLGDEKAVEQALKHDFKLIPKVKNGEKYIALSPFIALIIFFVSGYVWGAWHPAWMAFLLIPLTAIFIEGLNKGFRFKLTAMMPFLAVITFILLGFLFNAWHPAWLVFLLIPVIGMLESGDEILREKLTGLSFFVGVMIFVIVGYFTGVYTPTWLFMLLPLFFSLFEAKHETYRLRMLLSLVVSIGLYLYLGYFVTNWILALLAFTIYVTMGLLYGKITIVADYDGPHATLLKLTFVASIVAFLVVGYFFSAFAVSWLFILVTPTLAVLINEKRRRLSGISPFVAVTAFILLGVYFEIWYIAWLVFLIIPMIAIIEDR